MQDRAAGRGGSSERGGALRRGRNNQRGAGRWVGGGGGGHDAVLREGTMQGSNKRNQDAENRRVRMQDALYREIRYRPQKLQLHKLTRVTRNYFQYSEVKPSLMITFTNARKIKNEVKLTSQGKCNTHQNKNAKLRFSVVGTS